MTIDENTKEVEYLVRVTGLTVNEIASRIERAWLLYENDSAKENDTMENQVGDVYYGFPLSAACEDFKQAMSIFRSVFKDTCIRDVHSKKTIYSLLNTKIMGTGDCPDCGCEHAEELDRLGHIEGGSLVDADHDPQFEGWVEVECDNCNAIYTLNT